MAIAGFLRPYTRPLLMFCRHDETWPRLPPAGRSICYCVVPMSVSKNINAHASVTIENTAVRLIFIVVLQVRRSNCLVFSRGIKEMLSQIL
jgi:hypothetical protein